MKKQKNNISRDEYKKVLTFIQNKIGIKVIATRNCWSIEDCDVAFFKILRAWEKEELERLRKENLDLQNDNIALELKVDKLESKITEVENENTTLQEKIQEREENVFIRFLKFIFG